MPSRQKARFIWVFFLSASLPILAYAQDNAPLPPQGVDTAEGGLQDIVVTAQKRSQNIQDVPIAISAFGARLLSERSIGSIAGLANLAPNVSLDAGSPFSGSTAVLSAYIRGIGQDDFAMNLDPGVGVYLDGVYLARTVGANMALPDVERVEILKGPQGTLFGRNTIGGAISVITRDPKDHFAFTGAVTVGGYDRLDTEGSADLPIANGLSAMVTFAEHSRRGYQKRIPYEGATAYAVDPEQAFLSHYRDKATYQGGESNWTIRGKVKWEPAAWLTIRLSGDYLKEDQPATASSVLGVTSYLPGNFAGLAANNIPDTAFDPTGLSGFSFGALYNFCIGATPGEIAARNAAALCGPRGTPLNPAQLLPGLGSVNVDGDPTNDRLPYDGRWLNTGKGTSYATGDSYSKFRNWGFSGIVDATLSDGLSLKSITGYRKLNWGSGLDADNSPLQFLEYSMSLDQWQFSQEVQLLGHMNDKKINYVVGGYYFEEKGHMMDLVTFSQGLLQPVGPNDLKTKNYAVFGQFDWRVNDLIGITAGGRYTHEDKTFLGAQSDLNGFNYKLFNCDVYADPCTTALGFPNSDQPLRYYIDEVQKQSFNNFSPKVGIQIYPVDHVMMYGSWSRGYKTGGWTTRLSNPAPTAPSFSPEHAETFEIGLKSTLFDRRIQFNTAIFTTKFDGIQLNFQQGVSPTIQNAGNARIRGFEMDILATAAPGLTVSGSLGYTDASYTDVLGPAQVTPNPLQAGVYNGAPLPKTPKWKATIGPRYELDLAGHGSLVFLADYTYTSSQWNDADRTFLLQRKHTNVVNASVKYTPDNGNWNVTVGGNNLTNDRYITTGHNDSAVGVISGTWSRPAEWYARLGIKF